MNFSRRELTGLFLMVLGFAVLAVAGFAQATNSPTPINDGSLSVYLTNQIYCDARGLLTGNIGLMIGLLLVVVGLWSLVTGGGWFGAVITIVAGAAVPSLPALVEGFFIGLSTLLSDAQMSARPFIPPNCPAVLPPDAAAQGLALQRDSLATK